MNGTAAGTVLIDTCVLVPPILREIVLGAAAAGVFRPLWSPRILGEWQRVAARTGVLSALRAEGEMARMAARWPDACVETAGQVVPGQVVPGQVAPGQAAAGQVVAGHDPGDLPDPGDLHVLAAARAGGADAILTANLRDFPARALAPFGLRAVAPDALLMEFWLAGGQGRVAVEAAVMSAAAEAARLSGHEAPLRSFLKAARLPRLGRALASD